MTDGQRRIERAARSFRDLIVWQEANELAKIALHTADAMPSGYSFLADQLRRAATSIPLNIAEGNGKPTRRDYLKFLGVARGSLNEVEAITEQVRGTTLATPALTDELAKHVARTGRLLTALSRALKQPPAPK